MRKVMTLCIIHEPDKGRVLLGMKKKGFGEGNWNGFGGKVKEDESIEDAAIRELREEAGIIADKIEKMGVIEFHFDKEGNIFEVHIFKASDYSGIPRESDEMRPQWFNLDEIPLDIMWPDDKYWMPLFLKGKKFRGKFFFEDPQIISSHELEEVDEIGWK